MYDLGLHCLPMSIEKDARLIFVKISILCKIAVYGHHDIRLLNVHGLLLSFYEANNKYISSSTVKKNQQFSQLSPQLMRYIWVFFFILYSKES